MTVIADRLENITLLRKGPHASFEEGGCLLETVAYIAGEPHSDHPSCTSPILGAFGRALNDTLPDDRRQELLPLAVRLVGTAGNREADQRRGLMAMDWLVRTYLPAWLRLVPNLGQHAELIEGLPELTSWDDVERVTREALTPARTDATAAWDAGVAAGVAAWDAGVAARAAAGAAAGDALAPTVTELQTSAIALFEQMIEVSS